MRARLALVTCVLWLLGVEGLAALALGTREVSARPIPDDCAAPPACFTADDPGVPTARADPAGTAPASSASSTTGTGSTASTEAPGAISDSAPTAGRPSPDVTAAAPHAGAPAADLVLDDAEVIEISDTAPAESASSVLLTLEDLKYRSRTQMSDILRQVPGVMVSQHAGGGKSDQYFLRGFDADHGTDVAIYADGIPVNLPSHGHGQGYADTHFLIPETIATVDVHKGPYAARFGDFYTAGAMELHTLDKVAGPTLWIAGGMPLGGQRAARQYNRRLVGMASPALRDHTGDKALIAAQIADSDGPFENRQRFRQGNALIKWQGRVGRGDLELATSWYAASWNASGQVPASAVAGGMIDRFGSLDPSEGGDTSRTSVQLGYRVHDDQGGLWRASLFGLAYRLRLFSNFTLFARDPEHGDAIEQGDARLAWGLDAGYERRFAPAGLDTYLTAGVQIRNDNVQSSLWQVENRMRLPGCFDRGPNPCNDTFDRIRDIAGYAEAKIHVLPSVHVLPAIRLEQVSWDVDDLNPATRTDPMLSTSGNAARALALPKLSVEAEATRTLDLFFNAGTGFHSNDARASVTRRGAGALGRARGAEIGFRTTAIPRTRIAAAVWYLDLDSELVWSGDAGGTVASDPSRRHGVDIEAAVKPTPWLRLDGNLSIARASFVQNAGNSNGLALAPRLMGQGGATLVRGPSFVSLRGRGIADRPANDAGTLTAEGHLIFDLIAGHSIGKLDLELTVNNLLDADWREAQFADQSAVMPGGPVVEQMHFTPGIPLTTTLTAAYRF